MSVCVGTFCDGAEDSVQADDPVLLVYLGQRLLDQLGPICRDGYANSFTTLDQRAFQRGQLDNAQQRAGSSLLGDLRDTLRSLAGGQRSVVTVAQAQGTTPAFVAGIGLALAANRTYQIEYKLVYRTSGLAAGMQVALNFGGAASSVIYTLSQVTATSVAPVVASATAFDVALGSNGVGPGAVDMPANLSATITTTAAGMLRMRFQATGLAGVTATVQAGSTGAAFEI